MKSLSGATLYLASVVLLITSTASFAAADEDYYAILGLSTAGEDATEREIKSAWRQLSKKHHPDVSGEADREAYQRIQRAYEVLGDRRKRKVYDILGVEGLKKLEQPQQQQQQHPFMQLFGGKAQSDRGEDMNLVLQISLEDVYSGVDHSVRFSKTKICRVCRGTGAKSPKHIVRCPHCRGVGRILSRVQLAPGFIQQVEQLCGHCKGSGTHVSAKCPTCKGLSVVRGDVTISVDIEAGIPEGHVLTYELEANQEPGRVPGDVLVTVVTAPHPRFERRGIDLHLTMKLTLKEALLGFEKIVPHLAGRTVVIDEEQPVHHASVRRIAGEGMPKHHVPSERGDLVITYEVEFPVVLTEAQREGLEKALP